jgi:ribose transport system permease protein
MTMIDREPLPQPTSLAAHRIKSPSCTQRLWRAQATPVAFATLALFVIAAVVVPKSLTHASLLAMMVPASVMAVAAIGQTLVVQQKGIDLSVAGAITLSATVLTVLASSTGLPFGVNLLLVACTGTLAGLLNGFLIVKLHITPIVATLASNSLLLGAVWTVSGGSTTAPPDAVINFASTQLGPLPALTWLAIVLVATTGIFMTKSTVGRRFVGVGANAASARAAGVPVNRYILSAYVASGLSGGVAGVLLVGYLGSSSLTLGAPYQLSVITAVVVGGAALSGGRGSVLATAIACLFLSQVVQMVLALGAPNSVQLLVQSVALALAAGLRLVPWQKFSIPASWRQSGKNPNQVHEG